METWCNIFDTYIHVKLLHMKAPDVTPNKKNPKHVDTLIYAENASVRYR